MPRPASLDTPYPTASPAGRFRPGDVVLADGQLGTVVSDGGLYGGVEVEFPGGARERFHPAWIRRVECDYGDCIEPSSAIVNDSGQRRALCSHHASSPRYWFARRVA